MRSLLDPDENPHHHRDREAKMIGRLASTLRRQWMASLALFLLLTGSTAYGLAGSNTVFSDDISNGEVKGPDVATNAVTTDELRGDGVQSADVRDDTLAGGGLATPDLRAGSVGASEVVNDSLTGLDVDEAQLGQVPSALTAAFGGTGGALGGATCDPTTAEYITCEDFSYTVPAPTRFLVLGDMTIQNTTGHAYGSCRLAVGPSGVPGSFRPVSDLDDPASARTVAVSAPIGPGVINVRLDCRQTDGDLFLDHVQLSAVALSSN
jgi:hypothetical protein